MLEKFSCNLINNICTCNISYAKRHMDSFVCNTVRLNNFCGNYCLNFEHSDPTMRRSNPSHPCAEDHGNHITLFVTSNF